ncbi:MAG: winged helix DNA-binding domain-containing protein, partial [Nocardioides sp.]|nr:winged helix DNA-binding domain-containing protein [Nocardioides sp.]
MLHITDDERRARLAARHAIAPGERLVDPEAATRAMTVLHATEPASVYLSVAARTEGVGIEKISTVLYDERSLVKQLAMRRTLWVFPRDLLPAAWGSVSARVATQEQRKIAKDVAGSGIAPDGDRWVEESSEAILAELAASGSLTTAQIKDRVPQVAGKVSISPGTKWGGDVPLAPRLMALLGARGDVVRGENSGSWRLSRIGWTPTARWLGESPEPTSEQEGYAELVRRWLLTFGPGTLRDLQWWLGTTITAARRALADVGAVEVSLDAGGTGWVHPKDADPDGRIAPVQPWAALLPVLDPTTMGWKERDFYLDREDVPYLFDTNGN